MKTNITEYRCDRCGFSEGVREDALSHVQDWRRLFIILPDEGDAPELGADLCPACVASCRAWLNQAAAIDARVARAAAPASRSASEP